MAAKTLSGPDEREAADLKVRPLVVDGRTREFAIESVHDVTDRLFVVRRAFRVNDLLPEDKGSITRWQWEKGGWLLVDRQTGRISAVNLADFDGLTSGASWYRDYVAYCGISDDGQKLFAIVAQLGRRKPVLRHALGEPDDPLTCAAVAWQRQPPRITFESKATGKLTFVVRNHAVDLVTESDEPTGTD